MVRESLAAIRQKPQDEAQLGFTEQRLDRAHSCVLAADLDSIPDSERRFAAEVTGRDQLVGAAELIAIVDPSHRGSGRYAGRTPFRIPRTTPAGCSVRGESSRMDEPEREASQIFRSVRACDAERAFPASGPYAPPTRAPGRQRPRR
jgi:hypothetical protein